MTLSQIYKDRQQVAQNAEAKAAQESSSFWQHLLITLKPRVDADMAAASKPDVEMAEHGGHAVQGEGNAGGDGDAGGAGTGAGAAVQGEGDAGGDGDAGGAGTGAGAAVQGEGNGAGTGDAADQERAAEEGEGGEVPAGSNHGRAERESGVEGQGEGADADADADADGGAVGGTEKVDGSKKEGEGGHVSGGGENTPKEACNGAS